MPTNTSAQRPSTVVWFRRDLRVADHPALSEAARTARTVVPLFVLDERLLSAAPARSWYLQRSLAELDAALRARGSGLLVRVGAPESVVPEVARRYGAELVLATRDVTPFSHRRDKQVAAALEREGGTLALRSGLLLAEPEDLTTSAGTPYGVFTPFWRSLQGQSRRRVLPAPSRIPSPTTLVDTATEIERDPPPPLPGLPRPGEAAALERLDAWVRAGLGGYGSGRDVLSGEHTSHLGVDLHFGTLSPLQVETAALDAEVDATPFVRQLAWREFYHHLLFHRRAQRQVPDNPLMAAFRQAADDPEAVHAWWEGRTGVPVVDAGMRQLAATGWLSNRARLVVASFLTRHLLMDYRVGERHFMRHLLDGDVANNRGGWQWTAGVGADAQPWFRIFNPVRQGLRFDPEGRWVRRWVPELRDVDERHVHAPWEAPVPPAGYPAPIVDLAVGRARALAAFKAATDGAGSDRD
jgi:deoxyribodipyrimidine photo-lyase